MKKIKKFLKKYKKPQYLETRKKLNNLIICGTITLILFMVWVVFKFIIDKNKDASSWQILSGVNCILLVVVSIYLFILFFQKKKEEDERVNI